MGGHRRGGRRQQKSEGEVGTPPAGQQAAAAAPQRREPKGARGLRPTLDVVMRAINSLYQDQLKPFGRILRKRLAEQASDAPIERLYVPPGQDAVPLPEVDVTHLRAVCEACSDLLVQPEEGGDWSAVLKGHAEAFVDVYSLDDPYSAKLWAEAEAYFGSLTSPGGLLPGGRYACAQALACKGLGFFSCCSLGQICHVVQLAITQRKVLGYCNGAVVPYRESQCMMKEQCAEQQQPCANGEVAAMPLATWEVARTYLREILQSAAPAGEGLPTSVPLSNVKRLFRSRYRTELSETMLGHSRLSDLIQDEHFHDLCSLELQKSGYVVVQRLPQACTRISLADSLLLPPQPSVTGCEGMISLAESLRPSEEPVGVPRPFCVDEPLLFEELGQPAEAGDVAFLSMSTPLPSPGVPASTTVKHWLGEPHRLDFLPTEIKPISLEPELASEPRRVAFCPDEPLCLEDASEGPDALAPLVPLSVRTPLPSPGEPPSATVRKWTGLSSFFAADPPAATPPQSPSGQSRQRVGFCLDEPLSLEEVRPGIFDIPTPLGSPGVPGSATVRRWTGEGLWRGEGHRLEFFQEWPALKEGVPATAGDNLSPLNCDRAAEEVSSATMANPVELPHFALTLSALSIAGLVQNTFIHAKLPPPTPLLARRRAHSVPRDSAGAQQGGPLEAARSARPPSPKAEPPSALQRMLVGLEPLEGLEEPAGRAGTNPAAMTPAEAPRWLAVSPVDRCVRLTVRNTFLHSAPTPGTGAGIGAARRSQSTPPDASLCNGAVDALGRALRVLPQLLDGIESKCDIALTPGACKSPDALPAVVPLSPALTASPTDCTYSWLGGAAQMVGAQRVVRLAEYI